MHCVEFHKLFKSVDLLVIFATLAHLQKTILKICLGSNSQKKQDISMIIDKVGESQRIKSNFKSHLMDKDRAAVPANVLNPLTIGWFLYDEEHWSLMG